MTATKERLYYGIEPMIPATERQWLFDVTFETYGKVFECGQIKPSREQIGLMKENATKEFSIWSSV